MRSWAAVRSSSVTRLSAREMTGPVAEAVSSSARGRRRGRPRRGRPRRRGARSRAARPWPAPRGRGWRRRPRARVRLSGAPGRRARSAGRRSSASAPTAAAAPRPAARRSWVPTDSGSSRIGRPREPPGALERPGEDRAAVDHEPGGEDRARRSGQGDGRPGHLGHGGDGEEAHERVVARVAAGCGGVDQAGGCGGRRGEHQPGGRGPDGGGGAGGRRRGVGRELVVEVAVGGGAVVHLDSRHDFRCSRKGTRGPRRHRGWSKAFFVARAAPHEAC